MKRPNVYRLVAEWVNKQPVEVLMKTHYLYYDITTFEIDAYLGQMNNPLLVPVCKIVNGVAVA